jgi:hypothetical protein
MTITLNTARAMIERPGGFDIAASGSNTVLAH